MTKPPAPRLQKACIGSGPNQCWEHWTTFGMIFVQLLGGDSGDV